MEVDEAVHEDSPDREDDSSNCDNVADLMEKLEQSPYQYDCHLQLLAALREMNSVQALRDARENMNKYFPLAPDIWLSWIRDESNMAESPEEKQDVLKICERAVKDYLSVDVWLEYCQLSICLLSAEDGAARVRDVFEQAISAGGLHVTRGAVLWEAYREFETCLLASAIESGLPEAECREKVTALFHRQLRVPLANIDATWLEYETWCAENTLPVSDNARRDCEAARKLLPELMQMEELVAAAESSSSEEAGAEGSSSNCGGVEGVYQQYLQLELLAERPVRVLLLLERAVTASCLSVPLWQTYTRYLDQQLRPEHQLRLRVHERAVRNVPWCAQLWQHYILAAERADLERSQVEDLFSRALCVGFHAAADYQLIWLTWLEYMHRRLRSSQPVSADRADGGDCAISADTEKTGSRSEEAAGDIMESMRPHFERASEHLSQLFGLEGDPDCTILQYWAELEAVHGNLEKTQQLWNDIMSQGGDKSAATWLKMIQVVRRYGTMKQVRRKFHEAMERTVDWPESVMLEWTEFERLYGTISTWDDMNYRYRVRMKRVEQLREKQLKKEHGAASNGKQWPKNRKNNKLASKKREDTDKKKPTRAAKPEESAASSAAGVQKMSSVRADTFKVPSKPSARPDPGATESSGKRSLEDVDLSANKRSKLSDVSDDPERRSRTVFISNLNYDVTETELVQFFSDKLNVSQVRLVKDYRERSKGFGYIELSSISEVNAALKLDRSLIGQRPCFISRMRTEQANPEPAFKYSDSVEENKLFVRGLATDVTADDLRSLFEPFGKVTDVRLVTYRNGHSKGLAYVEFSSKSAASQALLSTDQQMYREKRLTVAISNPPRRGSELVPVLPSLAQRPKPSVRGAKRGRGPRLQLSFTPRSVRSAGSSANT